MSDILALALVIAVAATAIVTIVRFSGPRHRPVQEIEHIKEAHTKRIRVLEHDGEMFQINECNACEERWPCTVITVIDWIDNECS